MQPTPTQTPHHPTDEELEASVARTLLIGVLIATAIVLGGGVLYLRMPLRAAPAYAHFHESAPALRSLTGVWQGALHADAASLIQLGLMVLIATPIARVALCLFGFARQRDKLYVVISATVLCILLFSLVKAGH